MVFYVIWVRFQRIWDRDDQSLYLAATTLPANAAGFETILMFSRSGKMGLLDTLAYCAVTPKMFVREMLFVCCLLLFVPPLPPVNGHLPKNHKIHSQNGLERCPIDHFRDPKIRRFRNSKPAFSDQKKVQKMIIFWIWTCWDPKIRRFRNSKPAFGDLKSSPKVIIFPVQSNLSIGSSGHPALRV